MYTTEHNGVRNNKLALLNTKSSFVSDLDIAARISTEIRSRSSGAWTTRVNTRQ